METTTTDRPAAREPRPDKVAVVQELRERFSAADAVMLTEYRGLKVSDLAELRRALRPVGGDYKIYKNTLVRRAVSDLGVEGVDEFLVGPTAIAFVDGDAVGVAKALRDFAKGNPALVLKGGVLGDKILSSNDIKALADILPREVLLARLAGGMAAPMQQFAGLLQALPRNLAYGLKALIDQRGGAEEPVVEAPVVEPEVIPVAEAAPAAEESTPEAVEETAEESTSEAVEEAAKVSIPEVAEEVTEVSTPEAVETAEDSTPEVAEAAEDVSTESPEEA